MAVVAIDDDDLGVAAAAPQAIGGERAAMVARTKQGTSSLYSIADPAVFELCELVCGGLRRQVSELDAILQPGVPS